MGGFFSKPEKDYKSCPTDEKYCCNGSGCLKSIDDKMNKFIFAPPKTSANQFYSLVNNRNKLIFVQSESGNSICTLKISSLKFSDKYILFCHGNASDIYGMYPYLLELSNNCNVNVIALDYSGYGLSTGKPTEKNCYKDISSILKYMENELNINKKQIILMGQSLGTGIVVNLAMENNWEAPIILISPYKTIVKVLFDSSLSRMKDKFKTIDKIGKLNCAIKIYHGKQDELIKISHSEELYKKIKNKKFQPSWIEYAGHNDILEFIKFEELEQIINS